MSNTANKPQEQQSYKNDEPISCKVIIVGDSGVGKTTIIGRYLNKYNPYEKNTIGASFSSRREVIDNYQIIFDIWDTAGQERFHSVNKIFYNEAYICLLVYDITNNESFVSLKNYWYDTVKENSLDGIIFAVAGNKIDMVENEKVNQKEVKEFCEKINAEHKLTSAKQNTAIDDLFILIGKRFLDSKFFKNIETKLKKKEEEKRKKKLLAESKTKKKGWC